MRAQSQPSFRRWPALVAGAAIAALALLPAPLRASPETAADMVDCKLPPQIRSLGRNVTYLAAGRLVRVPVAECKLRGGTWKGGGPGARAGTGGTLAVTVGTQSGVPACPLQATVAGLRGSSSLAVRAGPGTGFARVDRLANGRSVHLCDRAGNAGWVGIVYASDAREDCGLSAPITPPRAYVGACRAGWVRSNYLR